MKATEKMRAIGLKALHEHVQSERPKIALETLYRWAQALDGGAGISYRNMQALISASSGTPHPIAWADFLPAAIAEPVE